MNEPTQKISVGEMKFRAMVSDLMVMESPHMEIECPTSSKARSLRRMFYLWSTRLAAFEGNFVSKFSFKIRGRVLLVEPKLDFVPKEVPLRAEEESNVSNSKGLTT